jgi:hypothetical protein
MIQPLRTNHRRIFLGLALLVSAVFVAGLLARPEATAPAARREAVFVAPAGQTWKNHLFTLEVSPTSDINQTRIVPSKGLLAPDVLIYYSDVAPQDSLPANAILLGRWDPSATYSLLFNSGFLVMYSGAQKSVLDFTPLGGRP